MPGTIKHEWNGTVLTITSDSGTSSSDLKGVKGDDGIRGPQGIPGECLHRHELNIDAEQQATARKNINAYRAINETGDFISLNADAGLSLSAVSAITHNQAGSGDASPDNVRPIRGYDECRIVLAGKNLCSTNGGTYGKALDANGNLYNATNAWTSDYINLKPSNIYTMYNTVGDMIVLRYTENKEVLQRVYVTGAGTKYTLNGNTTAYIRITTTSIKNSNEPGVMLELGSTKTGYEVFKGLSNLVNFNNTIYGGSYDWQTGKLIKTWGYICLTGNENITLYNSNTSGNGVRFAGLLTENTNIANGVSSHTKVGNYLADTNNIIIGLNNTLIYWTSILDILGYTEIDDFKEWLAAQYAAGTPVQIVYELATPIETYLSPYDLETLEGYNYIWSDTGKTKITNLKGNSGIINSLLERVAALEDNIGG